MVQKDELVRLQSALECPNSNDATLGVEHGNEVETDTFDLVLQEYNS